MDLACKDGIWCNRCDWGFHYQCFKTSAEIFPSRLEAGKGLALRRGDTRRTDFVCPRCNVEARVGRELVKGSVKDAYLLEDLVALMRSDYIRLRGEAKVEMALANFALHLYTQAGLRANEAFSARVGDLEESFCFGEMAARKKIRAHFKVKCGQQTKENRFSGTEVRCCYQAKTAPLKAGLWAQMAVQELKRVHRGKQQDKVFSHSNGVVWTMGWFWATHIEPRLERLKEEKLGGLEKQDLTEYGTNSFRRTWNTLAGQHPDPVSKDLRDRQARWRYQQRRKEEMASLYFDPRPNELLIAAYWL